MLDLGYTDYESLYRIQQHSGYFVTRTKPNLRFKRMYPKGVEKNCRFLSDQIGKLENIYSSLYYPRNFGKLSIIMKKQIESSSL
jgi:hypothetical protein